MTATEKTLWQSLNLVQLSKGRAEFAKRVFIKEAAGPEI